MSFNEWIFCSGSMVQGIILTFDSPHNVIRYFAKKFAQALANHGIDTILMDTGQPAEIYKTIKEMKGRPFPFTCSFNLCMVVSDNKNLIFPHFCYCIDPAPHFVNLTMAKGLIFGCGDRLDLKYFLSKGVSNTLFLPLAVDPQIGEEVGKERIYDVMFVGSCHDPIYLQEKYKRTHSNEDFLICEEAIAYALSYPLLPFWVALDIILAKQNVDRSKFPFEESLLYIDFFLRGLDRIALIRSIKSATVHVFGGPKGGRGWEGFLANRTNVVIHPEVPFEDSFDIIRQSKIYLSSIPHFKYGCQGRIFTSLACGSVPITSESSYVREIFRPGEELFLYSLDKVDEVDGIVNDLLANEPKRRRIAASGREIVMRDHTWNNRVKQFLTELPALWEKAWKELDEHQG